MDRYLIELLQDQVLRGNKIGHGFVAEAWIEMVRLFNAKFGSHHDKDGLRNRYKHLRGQYNDIRVLLDQSGFSWDETGEMGMLGKAPGLIFNIPDTNSNYHWEQQELGAL